MPIAAKLEVQKFTRINYFCFCCAQLAAKKKTDLEFYYAHAKALKLSLLKY